MMRQEASGTREVRSPSEILVTLVAQTVEQTGELSQHPLGELIRESVAAPVSGVFRLVQGSVKSVVYFEEGRIVFAVSNVRAHRLAEGARKWNFVTEQQLAAAGTHKSDMQLGTALVESGALTPDKLSDLYSLQAATVLRPMLLWTEGTWTFDPRVRLAEDIQMQLNVRDLLIESARRLPPDFVAKRFDNTNELLSVNAEPPTEVELQPAEAYVLSRIGAADLRLHELIAISGLGELETYSLIYALALGGFLNRDRWALAFSDETLKRFRAVDAAVLKTKIESAERDGSRRSKVVAPVVTLPEPEISREQEIEQFFTRVESAEDFYEVLSVIRSADATTIKRKYHGLARRFHPDLFHQEAGTPLHNRLQTTFARVAQAYEMLKDTKLRASYDLKIEAEKRMRKQGIFPPGATMMQNTTQQGAQFSTQAAATSFGGADPANKPDDTEEVFERGTSALKLGNMPLAVALLAEAARREPKEARYRGYYGRSLASNKSMRLKAEAELKAAISLDADNASYRVMLAELYLDHGMRRRAQGEAQRVLVVDPSNAEALKLLQTLSSME